MKVLFDGISQKSKCNFWGFKILKRESRGTSENDKVFKRANGENR